MLLAQGSLTPQQQMKFQNLKEAWMDHPDNLHPILRARLEEIKTFFCQGKSASELSTETIVRGAEFIEDSIVRWVVIIGLPSSIIQWPPLE